MTPRPTTGSGALVAPPTKPFTSQWFPPDFIDQHCNPKDLVTGLEIPQLRTAAKSPLIGPNNVSTGMISELAHLTRALAAKYHQPSFTTLLTEDGRLFFGMPRKHSHPNCVGHSVECAAGIAAASGHHSFPLVLTYEQTKHEKPPFNGVVLERLAEHFVLGQTPDMKLVHVQDSHETTYQHSFLLRYPAAGTTRPTVSTKHLAAYTQFNFQLTQEEISSLQIPDYVLKPIGRYLRQILHNSTADGETRPGRKRHAACVFTADGHSYFGVNLRSDVQAADRCAEWNALSAALVGGDKERIAGVVVYSPDYDQGSVCCCGKCLNSLGDHIDPDLGDLIIAYMDAQKIGRPQLFTELPNISYAEAERARR